MQFKGLSRLALGLAISAGLIVTAGCGSTSTSNPTGNGNTVPGTGNGIQSFTERQFALVGNQALTNGQDQYNEFGLLAANATLSSLTTVNNGANLASLVVVNPQGNLAAAITTGGAGAVQLYSINATGGLAVLGASVPVAGATTAATWDITGGALYVGSSNAGVGQINLLAIVAGNLINTGATGALNVAADVPVAMASAIGLDGTPTFVVASTNGGNTDVTSLREGANAALTQVTADANVTNAAIGTIALNGAATACIGANLNGFAITVNAQGVAAAPVSANTTVLNNLAPQEAGGIPTFYVATNGRADNVGAFSLGNLGAITLIPAALGNNFSGGNNANVQGVGASPTSLAVASPLGNGGVNNFLFVGLNATTQNLNAFVINPASGALVANNNGVTFENPLLQSYPVNAGNNVQTVLGLSSNFTALGPQASTPSAAVIYVATGSVGQSGSLSAATVNGSGLVNTLNPQGQIEASTLATGNQPFITPASSVTTFGH